MSVKCFTRRERKKRRVETAQLLSEGGPPATWNRRPPQTESQIYYKRNEEGALVVVSIKERKKLLCPPSSCPSYPSLYRNADYWRRPQRRRRYQKLGDKILDGPLCRLLVFLEAVVFGPPFFLDKGNAYLLSAASAKAPTPDFFNAARK